MGARFTGSSLVMVEVTERVVPIVYPVPVASVKTTVSSGSTVVSAVGSMVRVVVLEPAAKAMVLPISPGLRRCSRCRRLFRLWCS